MGIPLRANVASVIPRRRLLHRSDIYDMIEDALQQQRNKMREGGGYTSLETQYRCLQASF